MLYIYILYKMENVYNTQAFNYYTIQCKVLGKDFTLSTKFIDELITLIKNEFEMLHIHTLEATRCKLKLKGQIIVG